MGLANKDEEYRFFVSLSDAYQIGSLKNLMDMFEEVKALNCADDGIDPEKCIIKYPIKMEPSIFDHGRTCLKFDINCNVID